MVGATVSDRKPACKMPTRKIGMDSGQAKRYETKQITSHYHLKKEAVFLFAVQLGLRKTFERVSGKNIKI